MAKEVRLWRVDAGDQLNEVITGKLDLEARLESWLAKDISVLDSGLLVIGRQILTSGGPLDLLCLDEQGDLVIVELKRDKTPRQITAQVLDYASDVVDFSNEQVRSIAASYLHIELDEAFKGTFGTEVPETLNGDHRMIVVGSDIDPASERIIKYLSNTHGININAATFQYFKLADGSELLTRVFFIEPTEVDENTRRKGSSKRRANLTLEELENQAEEAGVSNLYAHALSLFGPPLLHRSTTRSSVRFDSSLSGARKVVLSLLPDKSSAEEGLHFQLYRTRYADVAEVPIDQVEGLLPQDHRDWAYASDGNPDYQGFEGFLRTERDIDKIAIPLKTAHT